jgi:hypothetical protein
VSAKLPAPARAGTSASIDERAARLRVGRCVLELELLGDPAVDSALRHVPDQHLACGRDGLCQRRILLQLAPDEGQRRRRRRSLQVRRDRLRLGGFPGLDAVDDDQPPVTGEEPEGVGSSDQIVDGQF